MIRNRLRWLVEKLALGGGAEKEIRSYVHDDKTRLNNPPAGYAQYDTAEETKKRYSYRSKSGSFPRMVWEGRAHILRSAHSFTARPRDHRSVQNHPRSKEPRAPWNIPGDAFRHGLSQKEKGITRVLLVQQRMDEQARRRRQPSGYEFPFGEGVHGRKSPDGLFRPSIRDKVWF